MTRLEREFRLISWDYRGLYQSHLPDARADLSLARHARDVIELTNAIGVDRFVFVGWSMGVQIGLELARSAPERVAGLVLMNGTYGRPLRDLPLPFAELYLKPLTKSLVPLHWVGTRIVTRAAAFRSSSDWLKRLGMIAPGFDKDHFHDMLEEFKTLDLSRYLLLLQALYEHDARDVLDGVEHPTLLVTGTRDVITPPRLTREMAARIRGSELLVVPGATHYAAVEFPDLITSRIERFLKERVPHHRVAVAPSFLDTPGP